MEGFFDGASRGNPGKAGAGALMINEEGKVIWETSRFLGQKTNNEAEYMALILLLKAAKEHGVRSLRVFGDSKLVVSQVSRQWKINLPHLRLLAQQAWGAGRRDGHLLSLDTKGTEQKGRHTLQRGHRRSKIIILGNIERASGSSLKMTF